MPVMARHGPPTLAAMLESTFRSSSPQKGLKKASFSREHTRPWSGTNGIASQWGLRKVEEEIQMSKMTNPSGNPSAPEWKALERASLPLSCAGQPVISNKD